MFYPSFGTKQVEIFLFIKLKSAILIFKNRQNQYSRIVIFTILEASKTQVKTLQNHDVIRLMKIILKRVKLILSIRKKRMG